MNEASEDQAWDDDLLSKCTITTMTNYNYWLINLQSVLQQF